MSDNSQMVQAQLQEDVKKSSGFIIATGILLLLMGMAAMSSPLVAGLSLAMVVGIMLIIAGIGQLSFAFQSGKGVFAFVFGGLTVAIGGYMVSRPDAALGSLTLFLAMYLIISGVFEALVSFNLRPIEGWGWTAFSGLLSVLLGIMIWSQFPLSGVWAVGILIGVRLFTSGLALLMVGLAARKQ